MFAKAAPPTCGGRQCWNAAIASMLAVCGSMQEEELQERERFADNVERELHELRRKETVMNEEQTRMQSINEELRGKLEDSKQQLKGNEQMIRWLNAQVLTAVRATTVFFCQPPSHMHACSTGMLEHTREDVRCMHHFPTRQAPCCSHVLRYYRAQHERCR
jgi:hypothetical protein